MPRARYITKRPKGRKYFEGMFSAQIMEGVGRKVLESMQARIAGGMDVFDKPAPALTPRYAKFKVERMHKKNLRDWNLTGITMGFSKVKRVREGTVTVGFLNGVRRYSKKSVFFASGKTVEDRSTSVFQVVRNNQRRARQWGLSPSDRSVLKTAMQNLMSSRLAGSGSTITSGSTGSVSK